jgi:hypothetical protein
VKVYEYVIAILSAPTTLNLALLPVVSASIIPVYDPDDITQVATPAISSSLSVALAIGSVSVKTPAVASSV